MRLENKLAFITGGGRGIGRAIALAFAGEGASVAVAARTREEIERVAEEIVGQFKVEAFAVECDVAYSESVKRAFERVNEKFGRRPDILVNNAGIVETAPFIKTDEAMWQRHLTVNLTGTYHCTRVALPAMSERGWGRIINIASLQSVRAFADCAPYGASKGAIAQLTRAQAEAWSRHGVNANAIAPGFFATELTAPVVNDEPRWTQMAQRTFVGRNGELRDLWGTALFLASGASDYVTGQTIFVDGGFSAG